MKQYILMADIISSRTKNQNQLLTSFKTLVHNTNLAFQENILSPLTITLGDEFQGIIKNANTAIDIIIHLEQSSIKNNVDYKLRYVLYYGDVETPVNYEIAYGMLGEGLTIAREELNTLKSGKERFFINTKEILKDQILNEAFNIYNNIVNRWNVDRDHEIISALIEEGDYKKVAKKLNRNRSLIWKRSHSLNISEYNSIKKIIALTLSI